MKNLLIILIVFFGSINIYSQDWQTNITKAKEIAYKNNIPIIMVFEGSDWCAPCIRLEREVWCTKEFRDYAKNHFVLLKVDFPKKRKNALSAEQQEKNNKLAEKYNKKGYFPFVVILDKKGNKLGETGYKKMTAVEYIKHLESFIH